jgi:hypothetical protein
VGATGDGRRGDGSRVVSLIGSVLFAGVGGLAVWATTNVDNNSNSGLTTGVIMGLTVGAAMPVFGAVLGYEITSSTARPDATTHPTQPVISWAPVFTHDATSTQFGVVGRF